MNFDNMVIAVRRRCASHTDLTTAIAGTFVNDAHAELLESHEWSRKRNEILILTVAEKTAGTVAVTNGSPTVTGTGTAFAAADVGKYIRIGTDDALYVVDAQASATSLTLGDFNGTEVNYAGDTSTSATYVIFQRWYNLGTPFEAIEHASYKQRLVEKTTDWLDRFDPERSETGDPLVYCLGPRDSSDLVQIEFYPRPTGTIAVRFNVVRGHTDLATTDDPIVPSPAIIWKAAILGCYFLHSKTEDPRWLSLASRYDKEFERAYERVKNADEKKYGLPHYIRDVGRSGLSGTDFSLDRDIDWDA